MMTKVATIVIEGQVFDLALGRQGTRPLRATLAREGTDLYDRPMAVEADLEGELDVAMVKSLLFLLAQAMQDRDAARSALQKGAGA